MLAALPAHGHRVGLSLRPDARSSYERGTARRCPTEMITLANAFIFVLLLGAAAIGVSSLVEKRSARRHRDHEGSSNLAS